MLAPMKTISAVARLCELSLDMSQLDWMITHSSINRYSKDVSCPYDVSSRNLEMREPERCWGVEADAGIQWAISHIDPARSNTPLVEEGSLEDIRWAGAAISTKNGVSFRELLNWDSTA